LTSLINRVRLLAAYTKTRHGLRFSSRQALERYQRKMIQRFINATLVRSPFYVPYLHLPLDRFPIMDKPRMMENFDLINTRGIKRDEAMAVAAEAEISRNFKPTLDGVSVGLSTGTSGRRGLFLANDADRMRWAGIMLGRMLPASLFSEHRIAFFLRANNNLYESVSGRGRIQFRFFDLITPLEAHLPALKNFRPSILIAPAQVLRELARLSAAAKQSTRKRIMVPRKIISVAEVLFEDDRAIIEASFGIRVDQVYQSTEGFLAYTCDYGRMHLNEAFLHIEPEWLDTSQTLFYPIITDFNRETQPIVRYRLDDVLTVDPHFCQCGSYERVISRVEGRADDILVLARKAGGGPSHLMPDFVVRALAGAGGCIKDFRVEQTASDQLKVWLESIDFDLARQQAHSALETLANTLGFEVPRISFAQLTGVDLLSKRRRVFRNKSVTL
jgi:putative adenylate-forming enzyme